MRGKAGEMSLVSLPFCITTAYKVNSTEFTEEFFEELGMDELRSEDEVATSDY